MKSIMIAALSLPLATAAMAQSADISGYTEIDDIDVIGADGEEVGEIENVLVDDSGVPVAYVVEINDGFLDLGDSDVVIGFDALTWENGHYTTTMTSGEVEALPVWDD
ncbi:PRC-barrel domain-containing protein [Tropicimonas sp. IMCC34011]|uniref:PRC-barrel domain-containing protein n=1 Tax=Tropicimonas sp. IMCC34011 TaxID=2248759 RepID=UPI000E21FA6B|nr:PRC-barrel domain-containing protein [Tropicimonas sp. IMCC34011]